MRICTAVSKRGARLAAAGLAAIVERTGKVAQCTAAVDGTPFDKHPHFEQYLSEALAELLPSNGVCLVSAQDGSGRGAAITAAVAKRPKHATLG